MPVRGNSKQTQLIQQRREILPVDTFASLSFLQIDSLNHPLLSPQILKQNIDQLPLYDQISVTGLINLLQKWVFDGWVIQEISQR